MHKMILAVALIVLAVASGCTYVNSAQGGNTVQTNEAWFTEYTGLGPQGLIFSTRVYYCPPMCSGGASTCMEAEMIDNAPAAAPGGAGAPPPAGGPPAGGPPPAAPPPPPPAGEGGGE